MRSSYVLVFLVLVSLPSVALADMDSILWGPSVVAGNGSSTEIVLANNEDVSKSLVVVFGIPYDVIYRFPVLTMNGSGMNDVFEITLGPRAVESFVVKSGLVEMAFRGWVYVRGGSKNPVLSGVSGYVTRIVGGQEYTSPLATWGNKFQFPVEESSVVWTAISLTKDGGSFYNLSDVTLTLLSESGQIITSKTYLGVSGLTQDSRFLWQHFASTVGEWRVLVGDYFMGKVIVSVKGWPIAATSIIVR